MTSAGFQSSNSAFKVPEPRKPKTASAPKASSDSQPLNSAEVDPRFLHLVHKLYTAPGQLSEYEGYLLRRHPVIGQLIEQAARLEISVSSFYVPVESILRPYASDKVKIYFRERVQVVVEEPQKQQDDSEMHCDASTTLSSTSDPAPAEPAPVERVGFYTKQERIDKIKKFKAKKLRALSNAAAKQVKYSNKSEAAKKRLRVKGKFVRA